MDSASPAVLDVFRCIESIEKRRNEVGAKGSGGVEDERQRRGKRRSQVADRALRERYYAVLQRKDGNSSLSERIKTLRRMSLSDSQDKNDGSPICRTIDRPLLCDDQADYNSGRVASPCQHATARAKTHSAFSLTTLCASPRPDTNGDGGQRHGRDTAALAPPSSPPPQPATSTPPTTTTTSAPSSPAEDHRCSLRGLVWKVLLGTIHTDSSLYTRLVRQGPSAEDVKIKEDTFRTFPRDEEFRRRVHEHKLSRINNAYVGGERRRPEADYVSGGSDSIAVVGGNGARDGGGGANGSGGEKGSRRAPDGGKGVYVQGMMVLCAPLLFVMPEVDAFFCFNSLLNQHMPSRYVAANLDGVHAGCALVDRVLSLVDPVLFNYLESKFLTANIYAFPLVMSLHACVPPLEEAVKLWDAVFSFGVHLEILICVAQCVSLRDTLLQDPNPYRHLNRNLPPLDAELLVSMAFSLIPHLPAELMDEIAQHPFMEDPLHDDGEGGI
ncbi:unnamed protein product [Scytosiphon promiscuus]